MQPTTHGSIGQTTRINGLGRYHLVNILYLRCVLGSPQNLLHSLLLLYSIHFRSSLPCPLLELTGITKPSHGLPCGQLLSLFFLYFCNELGRVSPFLSDDQCRQEGLVFIGEEPANCSGRTEALIGRWDTCGCTFSPKPSNRSQLLFSSFGLIDLWPNSLPTCIAYLPESLRPIGPPCP